MKRGIGDVVREELKRGREGKMEEVENGRHRKLEDLGIEVVSTKDPIEELGRRLWQSESNRLKRPLALSCLKSE